MHGTPEERQQKRRAQYEAARLARANVPRPPRPARRPRRVRVLSSRNPPSVTSLINVLDMLLRDPSERINVSRLTLLAARSLAWSVAGSSAKR